MGDSYKVHSIFAIQHSLPLYTSPNETVFNIDTVHKIQKDSKNFQKPIDILQDVWYNRIKIKELQNFIQAKLPDGI